MNILKVLWFIFSCVVLSLLVASISIPSMLLDRNTIPEKSSYFIEYLKYLCVFLGGSGVIISTYFTAMSSYSLHKQNIIENTFNLIVKWDDPHLFEARKYTREIKEKRSSISDDDLLNEIESKPNLKNSIILVLNYFESVMFSIETNRIDVRLFKRCLAPTLKSIAERFLPFSVKQGKVFEDDLKNFITLMSDTSKGK